MIEKQLIQALDPFIDDMVKIEKRLAELEIKEGPQGPQGQQGEAGADGKGADASEVAKSVALDADFIDTHNEIVKSLMDARREMELNEVKAILYD